jgi:hypothetical protein
MPVLEAPDTVTICANGDCSSRFDASLSGWDGQCDDCAAMAADHDSGLHAAPFPGCTACL